MAPELMNSIEDEEDTFTIPRKTWRTDVYAFGLVILEVKQTSSPTAGQMPDFWIKLLSDRVPFFQLQTDLHVMVEVMKGGRPPRPRGDVAHQWLTDPIWDFVQRLFAYESSGRPPMQEVVAKLQTFAWQFSIQQSPAIESLCFLVYLVVILQLTIR